MKQLTLSLIFIFSFFALNAQKYDFKVEENAFKFSDGTHNALTINLYELKKEDAEKLTKKWLKDFKGKVKLDDNEFSASGSKDKDMTKLDFNMKAVLLPNGDAFKVIVSIDLGGAYMNSLDHKKQFDVFKSKLIAFAKNSTMEGINIQLKNAKDELKENEKAQADLEKKKKDFEKDIEDAKQAIQKAEEEIKKNIELQGGQKEKIEESKTKVKGIEAKMKNI